MLFFLIENDFLKFTFYFTRSLFSYEKIYKDQSYHYGLCAFNFQSNFLLLTPPPPKKKVPYFQKVHAFKLPTKLKLMTYTSSTLLHHSSCVKCKK